MVGAAAAHDVDLADFLNVRIGEVHCRQINLSILDNGVDRIPNRLGLFVDLLHHEVLKAALFRSLGIHLDLDELFLDLLLIDVVEGDLPALELSDLVVADVVHISRVLQDRRHIGGYKGVLSVYPDDHRGIFSRDIQGIRVGLKHDGQGIGPPDAHHGT